MAIIHRATLTPPKQELLAAWLSQEVEALASYRFDDPDGDVGVEAFVVRRGDTLLHVVLTYRDAPLDGATLVGMMEHSVLGPRWVYDGSTDPVARGCYARALRGEQEQAVLEVWDGDTLVGIREPGARLQLAPGADGSLRIARDLSDSVTGGARLVAVWNGGSAVVARLG